MAMLANDPDEAMPLQHHNQADTITAEVNRRLRKTCITPIDR